MIEVEGTSKSFGATRALAGVDMSVPAGTVQGLLGPNGAGKTTLVRIPATLLAPGTGRARISGVDVQHDPDTVRSLIGLAGRYAAVDKTLTGRENLVMAGRLYRLGPSWPGPGPASRWSGWAGGGGGPSGEDLLGRHAPPPEPGRQPGRPAPGADPGRATMRGRNRHYGALLPMPVRAKRDL